MERAIENKKVVGLSAQTSEYVGESISANTKKAYQSDYRQFENWCKASGAKSLPATPAIAAEYFSDMAKSGAKASTISRRRAAIRLAHVSAGHADVTANVLVQATLKGIKRSLGTAPDKKSPVLTNDVKAMLGTLDDSVKGLRDRALLLIGFTAGMRRSELVGIDVEHIEECAEGIRLLIPRSKTDQEGAGRVIGIARGSNPSTCPVRALNAYLTAAVITEGSIFRSVNRHGQIGGRLTAQSVALVVKACASAAGLNPDNYSGHSLRAGLVTQAAIAGVTAENIMRQTGHKSHDTVMGYIRIANVFSDNASGELGL